MRFRASRYLILGKPCPSVCHIVLRLGALTRILQIFDDSRFDRIACTLTVAECTYSTPISTSFIAIWCPFPFTECNPSQSPFQYSDPGFRPIYQTDLPSNPTQDTLESDGGVAIVPLFHHSPNIPTNLIPASEAYADDQAGGGYFDRLVDSHRSLHPDDPERLHALCLLAGVDT